MEAAEENRRVLQSSTDLLDWSKVPAHYINAFFGVPDRTKLHLVALFCLRNGLSEHVLRSHLLKFVSERPLSTKHEKDLAESWERISSEQGKNMYGYNVASGQLLFPNGDVWEFNRRRPRISNCRYDRPVAGTFQHPSGDIALLKEAWRPEELAAEEEELFRLTYGRQRTPPKVVPTKTDELPLVIKDNVVLIDDDLANALTCNWASQNDDQVEDAAALETIPVPVPVFIDDDLANALTSNWASQNNTQVEDAVQCSNTK